MRKKVTLQDIAEDTGLSVSTVSRVLSQKGNISKKTESIVFESAHRLHYPLSFDQTPFELRENIKVALVTKHYPGEFFASLFDGFDESARKMGIHLHLVSLTHTAVHADDLIDELRKTSFDAAVIFMPDYHESDYQSLLRQEASDFPLVSIAPIASPLLDTVTFDNYRGGHLVASHFKDQGFQKVGIVHGPITKSEAMLRKNGFIDFIRATGSMELVWEIEGDYSLASGKAAFEAFKGLSCKPEAVFCSNDAMTLGFVHDAIREEYHIPEDVAVAGFDDLPACALYTPTITSVHTPYASLGKKALEIVFDRLKNPHHPHHAGYMNLIPVSLSIRESSTQSCYA